MTMPINKILLLYTDKYYLIKPVYPFGLDLLARYLRQAGYRVALGYPFLPHTDVRANLKELFDRTDPDLIGLGFRNLDTTMSCEPYGNVNKSDFQAFSFIPDFQHLVATIKNLRPYTPLIAGGGAFTVAPEAIMPLLGIDFGIAGEGEAALLQFVQAYPDPRAYPHIANLVYKAPDGYHANPRCAYSFAGYGRFTARDPQFHYAHETAGLPVQTKRGCHHRCSYCVEPLIEGRRYVFRDPDDVLAEMERLAERQPDVQTIFFVDTEFNTPDLTHCSIILKGIVQNALHQRFRFASQFLPRPFNPELAELLQQAGFTIILTADSFADEVLKQNGAAYRSRDILKAIALCRQFGLDCTVNLIFGLPGETRETLAQSTAVLREHPPDHRLRYEYTCGARIYPNTPLFRRVEASGQHPFVYGDVSNTRLEPCFYCAPYSPLILKKYIDDQIPIVLDFHNDYDTVKHETLALGYLADQERWHETVAQFEASTLDAKTAGYLYIVKKMAAAQQLSRARAVLAHLARSIARDDRGGRYADTLAVVHHYMNILTQQPTT